MTPVMEDCSPTQSETLERLNEIAPNAPFLALGQTVFWDEPMKAGLAVTSSRLGYNRKFVAGVHDTDYFAKLPSGQANGAYHAFPHNDTTTKDLWSAAGEFSCLFGSETVVSRDTLQSAGLKVSRVAHARPGLLDQATEAWGWRGIASTGHDAKIVAETPLNPLFKELNNTLNWALDQTLNSISGDQSPAANEQANNLRALVCNASETQDLSLSQYYKSLLPDMYRFVSGKQLQIEPTLTSELLRFNTKTCAQKRFEIVGFFLNPKTRAGACEAYDAAVKGSEIYALERFGSFAIPFELVVPGHGRGTLRIARKAIVIMTPRPLFVSLKKPITNVCELAEAIERKFGKSCTLVGKAVTLIGMLAREYVFVFHEGASSYVKYSRALHQRLAEQGCILKVNPILRVKYEAWDALQSCRCWLRLPEPLRHPFGAEELYAPSFAARWKLVCEDQKQLLARLGSMRSSVDLIRYLSDYGWSSWGELANEYAALHQQLNRLNEQIAEIKSRKKKVLGALDECVQTRLQIEKLMGEHWRAKIFEKQPSAAELKQRSEYQTELHRVASQVQALKKEWKGLQSEQDKLVKSPTILKAHERRQNIELEAELKRLQLARQAVIVSKGLPRASQRPSGWWFPLVCPNGCWFDETTRKAEYYLEQLI